VRLAVIVPVYNESLMLPGLLLPLRKQFDDDFDVVICDNGSTDGSQAFVQSVIDRFGMKRWTLIEEPQKGTGAAADTAAWYAIEHGATHIARIDADCVPEPNWTEAVKRGFTETEDVLFGGLLEPRHDEVGRLRYLFLVLVNEFVVWTGRLLPENRGSEFHGPYIVVSGGNMAITADMYDRAGGFPRTSIEQSHEDRDLTHAVRRLTPHYGLHRDMVVHASMRRIRAWGVVKTLAWYAGHRYRPRNNEGVDVRS